MLATQPVIREPVRLYMITTQTVLGVHHFISRNILKPFFSASVSEHFSTLYALRSPLYAASCASSKPIPYAPCSMPYACERSELRSTLYAANCASSEPSGASPRSEHLFTLYALRCELRQQQAHAPCSMPYALCVRASASTSLRYELRQQRAHAPCPLPFALCPMPFASERSEKII